MMQDTHIQPSRTTFPSWKLWLKTSRPFSLTATVSPILVGTTLAAYYGVFHIGEFVITLFSCLFLQIGTNYLNEYFDYRYGLDHAGSLGAMTVIFRNEMTANQVLGGGLISFSIATLLVIVMILLVGTVIILFVLAGCLLSVCDSGQPS